MASNRGKRSQLPPMREVAQTVREGTPLADIAKRHGVRTDHIQTRLNQSGWDSYGQPMATATPKPDKAERVDHSWRDLALCAEVDPALWFPEFGESVAEAKRVCARCEVRARCLDWALSNPDASAFGVWGGASVVDRKRMRKGAA